MKVWNRSIAGLVSQDVLKAVMGTEKKTLKLTSYCCSVQACNLILQKLPSQDANMKVRCFETFNQELVSHRGTLSAALTSWLAKEAGVDM